MHWMIAAWKYTLATAALGCTLLSTSAATAVTIYPVNNGFEGPNLDGSYGYANQGGGSGPFVIPGWTATGNAPGMAANGSPFNVANATNGNNDGPGGSILTTSSVGQAALLQGGDGSLNSSLSQALVLPAGLATLTYSQEARGGNGVTLVVYFDGVQVGTSTPTDVSGQTFDQVSIPLGLIVGGAHSIGFAGNNLLGGDRTTFIDNVAITVVPEPGALALLGMSVLAIAVLARRSRTAASG